MTTHRALLVEESEGLLELGPHGLGVWVLVGAEQVGRWDEAQGGQALVAHLLLEVEVNLVRGASV